MKHVFVIALALAVLFSGATVFAQQSRDMGTQGQERSSQSQTSSQSWGMQSQDMNKWKGKEVKGLNDEKIGSIKQFVTDNQKQAHFAVLSVSGKEIAIPMEALTPSADGKSLTVNMSKDQLKNAPQFSKSNLEDPSYRAELYRFYGVQPSFSDQSTTGSGAMSPGGTRGGSKSQSPGGSSYGTPGGSSRSGSGPSTGSSMGESTGQGK